MATEVTELAHVDAVPLFNDGSGNLFGSDLLSENGPPAVYFFDHEVGFEKPAYAAGLALGPFMLLLAQQDRVLDGLLRLMGMVAEVLSFLRRSRPVDTEAAQREVERHKLSFRTAPRPNAGRSS